MHRKLPLLALLLSLTLKTVYTQDNNFAAAKCCADGISCSTQHARQSGSCLAAKWMSQQPQTCRNEACKYCRQRDRRTTQPVCAASPITRHCFRGPSPRPTSAPTRPDARAGCVWTGRNGMVVVPVWRLKLVSYWSKSGNSITWRRDGGRGTDRAGTGMICMRVGVPMDGRYYMTVVSSAPHTSDHNDAWLRFDGGVDLYRPKTGSYRAGNSGWYKGYQNNGRDLRTTFINTVDRNAHQFVTKMLAASRTYTACISGRSSRFTLYDFVLIHCDKRETCSRFHPMMRRAVRELQVSRCS